MQWDAEESIRVLDATFSIGVFRHGVAKGATIGGPVGSDEVTTKEATNGSLNGSGRAMRLREWWQSPRRPGVQRWISPWEYRHLRGYGITRIAGGSVAGGAGLICLAYDADKWAAFFLIVGALNLAGGYWYLTIDRAASA